MAHAQAAQKTPEDILAFWLDDLSPEQWYVADDALDQRIRDEFMPTWEQAQEGGYSLWLTYPTGALAYIILMDQMPRNMFRGEGKAFSSDMAARAATKAAIDKGWDLRIDAPARQFFYLPLMHSESLTDQERCVRLMCERLPDLESNLKHAKAHREIIRLFGRFPYRNEALSRSTTAPEAAFLTGGGYAKVLNGLETVQAA